MNGYLEILNTIKLEEGKHTHPSLSHTHTHFLPVLLLASYSVKGDDNHLPTCWFAHTGRKRVLIPNHSTKMVGFSMDRLGYVKKDGRILGADWMESTQLGASKRTGTEGFPPKETDTPILPTPDVVY